MLIKPIFPLVNNSPDPASMSYMGNVEDNDDPEKLGRLRVRIAPWNELETEALPWASPMLGSHGNSSFAGGINIPEIGSQVRIVFPSQDYSAPYYTGAELNETNRVTLFDDNYPNAYGYKDANGNFIKIDKKEGTTHIQHESTANMKVDSSGSMQVALSNGASFTFSSRNNFNLKLPSSGALFAWICEDKITKEDKIIYTKSTGVTKNTKLYNRNGKDNKNILFKVVYENREYKIQYAKQDMSRSPANDVIETMVNLEGTADGALRFQALSDLEAKANEITLDANIINIKGNVSAGNGASGIIWGVGCIAFVENGIITDIKNMVG